jgi:ribosomal protein S18 acetylase RimI-like enzyme
MKFRAVKIEESIELAKIHLESFKDFFLSSLGVSFLNTYYKSCLKNDESIAVCAIDENENLIGFSVGCIRSKGFHKSLIKQNFISFMVQGIVILFTKPNALIRLISNLGKNADKTDDGEYAELLSIGVLPSHNGKGIGKELIKRFEEEAILRGCLDLALTTDFDENNNVLLFYKSVGYKIYNEFITYPNRKMYKLKKRLN